MVNNSVSSLDQTFGALAEPTRRGIVGRLARGPATTTELAAPFTVSLPAILKHLAVLERAGLICSEKRGRIRRYRLRPGALRPATEWLEAYRTFWEGQLDALDHYLEESQP